MGRVHEYLALIDDPDRPSLSGRHPADELLLDLLVHLSYSDGAVQDDELALIRRVHPAMEISELLGWIESSAGKDMDWSALRAEFVSRDDRLACMRFATRMACVDGEVTDQETAALRRVETALELMQGTVQACLQEVLAAAGEIREQRVRRALMSMEWRNLFPERGGVQGRMVAAVPTAATPLARMTDADDHEVAGLYVEGLVTEFATGPAFVHWSDVATYTRCPVPGASTHLKLVSGRKLSIPEDSQLRDVGTLLDLIYGRAPLAAR